MQVDPALSSIIDKIYEGPLEGDAWRSALGDILDLANMHAAFLAVVDNRRQTLLASTVVGPEESRIGDALDLYRNELHHIDPGFSIGRNGGGRFRFDETNGDNSSDPELWKTFIRHEFGSGDYHSLMSPTGGSLSVSLALHTRSEQTAITPEQERLHDIVFSHLGRAARLSIRRPEFANSDDAIILVDENGHILDLTSSAEAILSASDGVSARRGRILLSSEDQYEVMQRLVYEACHPRTAARAGSWMTVRRRTRPDPWLLRFEPLPLLPLDSGQELYGCVIRLLGNGSKTELDEAMIASIFGLTPREAQVAIQLADTSRDIRAIAQDLGIGYETARSHSRAVMAKAGASNRIELIGRLAQYR